MVANNAIVFIDRIGFINFQVQSRFVCIPQRFLSGNSSQ